jgi:hypothetical protein
VYTQTRRALVTSCIDGWRSRGGRLEADSYRRRHRPGKASLGTAAALSGEAGYLLSTSALLLRAHQAISVDIDSSNHATHSSLFDLKTPSLDYPTSNYHPYLLLDIPDHCHRRRRCPDRLNARHLAPRQSGSTPGHVMASWLSKQPQTTR